jgi:hypothetical protein
MGLKKGERDLSGGEYWRRKKNGKKNVRDKDGEKEKRI